MSIQQPDADAMERLFQLMEEAQWIEPGANYLPGIGSFAGHLTPLGVERLKTLHSTLVAELKCSDPSELSALVAFLDFLQKKYYPNG